MKGRGQGMARISQHPVIKPFINADLSLAIEEPTELVGKSPVPVLGYKATILPEICDALLDARKAGVLKTDQEKRYGEYAEILVRTFSKIGIIALVDEVTGFQAERDEEDLQRLLALYLSEERLKWARMFPHEYYRQLFRLKGWTYSPISVKPLSRTFRYYLHHGKHRRYLTVKRIVLFKDGNFKEMKGTKPFFMQMAKDDKSIEKIYRVKRFERLME
jgi:hypothetical protein